MFERDNIPDNTIKEKKLAKEDVMRAIAEDMADGEDGVPVTTIRTGFQGPIDGETIFK